MGVAAAVPFGSSTGLDPITQGLDASTQGYAPYAYGHYAYGKRTADADPYYAYGAYAVPFGSSTGLDPITQGLDASTQGYAPYAYGHYAMARGLLMLTPTTPMVPMVFPSVLPLDWTPSPRAWTLRLKALFLTMAMATMPTARGLLM